jgi:xanthine/CO dehydrogenase XdhC/CoxF family maturation factor
MQRAERDELRRHIQKSIESDGRVMLCELVSKQGSFYREVGFQCAVNDRGIVAPFVAGTCTDRLVAQLVRQRGETDAARDFRIEIDTGSPEDRWMGSGAGCGGTVAFQCREVMPSDLSRLDQLIGPSICTEPHVIEGRFVAPDPRLWIFGGADDAFPLARMARSLGWVVHLVDHRDGLWVKKSCPEADVVLNLRPESASEVRLLPDDHVIIMSHNIAIDLGWLQVCADSPPASVGLLGPVQRGERLIQEIEASQFKRIGSRLRLRCGAGIKTRSPQHIAFSMMLELQQLFEAGVSSKGDSLRKGGRVEVWHRH